jgi:hypothetical protein
MFGNAIKSVVLTAVLGVAAISTIKLAAPLTGRPMYGPLVNVYGQPTPSNGDTHTVDLSDKKDMTPHIPGEA